MNSVVAVVLGLIAGAFGGRVLERTGTGAREIAETVNEEVMRAFARLAEDLADIVAEARAQHAAERGRNERSPVGAGATARER